jgi:hypothetical protein
MPRKKGSKNRNYPPVTLAEAMKVPIALEDQASGTTVTRLTLADLLKSTPTSSVFTDLVASSRFYGLTSGGINASEFSLTKLGEDATGGDEVARAAALKAAVMNVSPYKAFFEKFSNKKMPGAGPFKEFLIRDAEVPADKAEECMKYIRADAETAGLVRSMKGGIWVDLSGTPTPLAGEEVDEQDPALVADEGEGHNGGPPELPAGETPGEPEQPEPDTPPAKAKKVFIAHGKNRTPLDQLKKALDQFKVKYAVAVDEAHKGRPISAKVAQLMQDECSSGIFIFTADERFLREKNGDTEEVWRPSENVVYELGAASILYENRIVIFKEKGVSFPSDFSDLGYIEFEKDQLATELGSLFSELVGLDILEVRAKG